MWRRCCIFPTSFVRRIIYEVLDAKEPENSAKLMGAWILEAQNSGLIEYENCGNTFIAWGKGILNSFKYGYTNGFTEGCNNKIKVLGAVNSFSQIHLC